MRYGWFSESDTIVAVATGPAPGAIGLVRASGPDAVEILGRIFRPAGGAPGARDWPAWQARYGHIVDPRSGEVIDEAVALVMRAPRSYTREDVVEVGCHGGGAVMRRVLDAFVAAGARLAEPGEFTRRAFLNGRIDLIQAEAVAELVSAQSDAARRAALAQLGGGLSRRIGELRQVVVRCLAHLETLIDFPEDEVDELPPTALRRELVGISERLAELAEGYREGRLIREGVRVAIVGKPNAGKSSLLNALLGEDRALVTDIPGTTRDVIQESVMAGGVALVLQDTAGVRETDDPVERLGVMRSRRAAREADVVVVVLDDTTGFEDADFEVLKELHSERVVLAINKVDTGMRRVNREHLKQALGERPVVEISARDGTGLSRLKDAIRNQALAEGGTVGGQRERVIVTRARHYQVLKASAEAVQRAADAVEEGLAPELVAVELREALRLLGELTGETVSDDVLDVIFREFCIGK